MNSKIGILYGREDHWSEEPQGGVYEKDKRGYYNDHKYEGEIENGKPNGNGTWEMGNGATYVGQWVNGLREGLGTFTWSEKSPESGKSYEGEYKNNRRHGKGKLIFEGGYVEEGNWIDNKLEMDDDESWREGGKDYTEEELQKRVDEIEKREKEYSNREGK